MSRIPRWRMGSGIYHVLNRGFWQGRFKSIVVQKENYMNRLGRYIERNPLAAKMADVVQPEDYPWSSAGAYVESYEDPLIDVTLHPYWNTMGETDVDRRNCYREFLSRPDDESVELFAGRGNIVGDDNFKGTVRLTNGRHVARNVGRPRKNPIVKGQ